MRRVWAVLGVLWCGPALAQTPAFAPNLPDPTVPPASAPTLTGPIQAGTDFITVNRYGSGDILNSNFRGYGNVAVSDIIAAGRQTDGASSAALAGIAARLDRFADRFREGIALAGSINVLPPNPGDRFAVSFGGAGYDGASAGSVAVSARVEDAIIYGAVARGPTQTLVKGGVGWSFR